MSTNPLVELRAVLFDVDGTLIDTADLVADSLAYASRQHLGRTLPREEYLRLVGRPLAVQARFLAPGHERQFVADAMRYYEEHADREKPFPGVLEALRAVRAAGLKTALVTSKVREELEKVLRRIPLDRYVDAIVTADITARPKPAPDPVLKAVELLGVRPEETLFIGDSPYDMASGWEAGARTAAALWGPHPRETLAKEKPTYWLEKPEDIVRAVGELA
ncbi:MAG: HAD-IA family hydrolase [Armatimonadetes bacterium]|nr:HAD-IA family hydrolase [Armatimonadota bacterium]